MKFRNAIFTLLLSFMTIGLFAQNESGLSSPVNQGDFIVGAASANVAVSDLTLSASVGYALTDQIVVGLSDLNGVDGDWSGGVFGRYYLNSPFFAEASFGYDSGLEETDFGVGVGVTGFLLDWLYVEPNLGVDFGDDTNFNLGLNFGLRF